MILHPIVYISLKNIRITFFLYQCSSNGYPHVFVETGALTEALAAHRALVGAVLLVDMENVDPQAVPLLERSGNQCLL